MTEFIQNINNIISYKLSIVLIFSVIHILIFQLTLNNKIKFYQLYIIAISILYIFIYFFLKLPNPLLYNGKLTILSSFPLILILLFHDAKVFGQNKLYKNLLFILFISLIITNYYI